jgi:Glycine rich protein
LKSLEFGRNAFSISVAATMLAGCGGSQPPIGTPGVANVRADSHKHHQTFNYTGSEQTFIVPAGVTSITADARGGAGFSRSHYESYPAGGLGGRVYAVLPVTPNETLYVFVGGAGQYSNGGFNGGGNAGHCCFGASGGGGGSDIREGSDQIGDRILVAGGGGGVGGIWLTGGDGGAGGTLKGAAGENGRYEKIASGRGGKGGAQTVGGHGGRGGKALTYWGRNGESGAPGQLGNGGTGGMGGPGYTDTGFGGAGGGGGGGYYGGGGGGGGAGGNVDGSGGGGGGGGSSYVERNATRAKMYRGWKNATGDGLVLFSWK